MKFSMLPQHVSLWKFMLNLFCTNDIQGRELCWHDFMKYTFNVVICQDTCQSVFFKLGMMLNMTNVYSLIPVWMTLMFTQGHRAMLKLELVHSFCCVKQFRCSWWLIMSGGWLWSPVSVANMDHLSSCSSSQFFSSKWQWQMAGDCLLLFL